MKRLLLCAVLVVGMAGPAGAANVFLDGNQLLAHCQNASSVQKAVCFGYVQGVADALNYKNPVDTFHACITTPGVTVQRVTDIAVAWLEANPSKRHHAAHGLVAAALQEAFPCKN